MTKQCIIIIPIYKKSITNDEQSSLVQCCNILQNFNICFVAPKGLECFEYKKIVSPLNINYSFKFFDKAHFENIISYSKFMLDKNFYKEFLEYKYMLIYQLDAWVFRDELQEWCSKGFDYIGAPWFEGYDCAGKNSSFLAKSGNGGFSLRNIENFYKTLLTYEENFKKSKIIPMNRIYKKHGIVNFILHFFKIIERYYSKQNTYSYVFETQYEDTIIANYFETFNKNFKVATADEAIAFSFEVLPEILFEMNNNKLPFGCHAFKKYNWNFWKEYIKIQECFDKEELRR